MKIKLTILFCVFFGSLAFGQVSLPNPYLDTIRLEARAEGFGDSIVVRWAPIKHNNWKLGNEVGYSLMRITVQRDTVPLTAAERKASRKVIYSNVKPWPLEQWRSLAMKDDWAFLAAGMLYDETLTIRPPNPGLDFRWMYEKQQADNSKYGYTLFAADQSVQTAVAAGLGYIDYDVKENEAYVYKVAYAKEFEKIWVEGGIAFVIKNKPPNLPKPLYFQGLPGDKIIQLRWNHKQVKETFTSYDLERSEDGGKTYTRRNSSPIVSLATTSKEEYIGYSDSIETNEFTYTYRVIGKTLFGQYSPPSDTVQVRGLPELEIPNPQIYGVVEYPKGQLQVKWALSGEFNSKIQGFELFRSTNIHEGYEKMHEGLLPPSQRYFQDEEPPVSGYYILKAIDVYDRSVGSFPVLGQLEDLEPPIAPIGLIGELDPENGLVTLQWNSNSELDLKGYRVFMSNRPTGHFAQVTDYHLEDTAFIHSVTMNTISERIYYHVIALDNRDNFSFPSETIYVERPDKHAPNSPVFTSLNNTEEGLQIDWANSSSIDVVRHELQRKRVNEEEWEVLLLDTSDVKVNSFLDTTAIVKVDYHFRIMAVDDVDLVTYSKILTATPFDEKTKSSVSDFNVKRLDDNAQILLTWTYPKNQEIKKVFIFRAKEGAPVTTYRILKLNDFDLSDINQANHYQYTYKDPNTTKDKSYTYQVLIQHSDGESSPISETQTISKSK